MSRLAVVLALIAVAVLLNVSAVRVHAEPARGEHANPKQCQKEGYLSLFRSDGSRFVSARECTRYAATGGFLVAGSAALSEGCNFLNREFFDGGYTLLGNAGGDQTFYAGETVTVTALFAAHPHIPVPTLTLEASGFVETVPFPGSITFVIPVDGEYPMRWYIPSDGNFASWQISCTG